MSRPGPPRTGSVEPLKRANGSTYWRARVRLADDSRVRVDVPEKYTTPAGGMTARQRAELYAEARQQQEDETGELLAEKRAREASRAVGRRTGENESADAWFDRYLPTKECGGNHRKKSAFNWAKWVSPVFGPKPMRAITRDDIEDVRDKLDVAIDANTLRHATARNIWSTVTAALKAAYASRDRTLRVLPSPLHFGMLPPKKGAARQRPWLYPAEWLQLVRCDAVPAEARLLYAIALYTGMRPGELRALMWTDVDLVARVISISKAFDEETRETKAPKTESSRRIIPIHERLLPLLKAVSEPASETDFVVADLANFDERLAGRFREHLTTAKITRARLTADNDTEEPIDFRSLRDSCATWLALAGVSPKVIQRRLGHKSGDTTDRYIKQAESFGIEAIGEPFPLLPSVATRPSTGPSRHGRAGKSVARVGFELSYPAEFTDIFDSPTRTESTRDDVSARPVVEVGPSAECIDPVEAALAAAAQAGRFDVVAQLAKELEARRLAVAGNVISLDAKRSNR